MRQFGGVLAQTRLAPWPAVTAEVNLLQGAAQGRIAEISHDTVRFGTEREERTGHRMNADQPGIVAEEAGFGCVIIIVIILIHKN